MSLAFHRFDPTGLVFSSRKSSPRAAAAQSCTAYASLRSGEAAERQEDLKKKLQASQEMVEKAAVNPLLFTSLASTESLPC